MDDRVGVDMAHWDGVRGGLALQAMPNRGREPEGALWGRVGRV